MDQTPKRLRDKVKDETLCGEGDLRICVSGKCQKVGCDLQLGSDAKLDKCGVCGGNGVFCGGWKKSRFIWEEERGKGSCSASCGGGFSAVLSFCMDTLSKKRVHSGFCDPKIQPQNHLAVCNNFPCPARSVSIELT